MITYIHGFLGCPEDWKLLTEKLPGPYEALATPDHIVEPVTLIGYSMGGRQALDFAARHPKLIESLVILSANPGIDDPKEREARRKWDTHWCDIIREEGLETFLDKWYAQPLFSALRKRADFPEILERRRQNDPEQLSCNFLLKKSAVDYKPFKK